MADAGFSRRDFLGAAGLAGLGSLLASRPARAADQPVAGPIPRRQLGRTGVELPILCHGAAIDNTQNQILLKQVLKHGVIHWDTAEWYSKGKSEEGIGMFFEKNPSARKGIFLVTKSGGNTAAKLTRSFNQSLDRLKTDYVDLYFFHGISDLKPYATEEVRGWVEKMKKEQKIRFNGFSTHKNMAKMMATAAEAGWIDALMTKIDYRIMHDDDMQAGLDACAKAGVGVIAMKTQGGGPINDTKADRELAGHFVKKGYTPQQAKVKAVLADERITALCSHMDTVEVLKSNVAAVSDRVKLDSADWKALGRHAAATCATSCAACGSCEKAARAPVPEVLRYLMYAREYGNRAEARELFRSLPAAARKRIASGRFARTEKACPRGLPIGRLMAEAALELG